MTQNVSAKVKGMEVFFQGISTVLGVSALSKPGKATVHTWQCYRVWCMHFALSIFTVKGLTQRMHEIMCMKMPLRFGRE